jgi:predicted RND superfamily exporter protein
MPQSQQSSPGFYKGMAILFFVLGGVFIWAAVHQHSWFYGAFGIITIVNGLMSTLKSLAARET